jgi:peptide/nickel transport system substrate-binding protein
VAAPTQAAAAPTQAPAAPKPTEAPAPKPTVVAQAPKRGGTLVVGRNAETPGLDPHKLNVLPRSRVTQNMYSYLVGVDKDMRPIPDLAERWEISPDGKTYTFFLRKGVKFHNGRDLTSEDIKYTIDRILDPSYASFGRTLMDSIAGVETPDPFTARVVLKNPDAAILASLASSWGGIVAREEVEKAGGELSRTEAGSGPYMLEEWIPNQALRLKRFPDYYDKNAAFLDTIVFQVIPEESNIIAQLRSGNVHLALLEDNKNSLVLKDAPNLDVIRSPRLGFDYINIDNQKDPWNKLEVRQAFSYAIDRREVLAVAASSLGSLVSPVPAALKEYALDPETFPEYKPDLNKAKELLAKAGLPNGFSSSVEMVSSFPTMVTGAQVVADQVKKVGIELELRQFEQGIWNTRWNAREYSLSMNITGGNADPHSLLYSRLHSKAQNQNNWSDPEVDELLEQGKVATDLAKRKEIYARAQRLLVERVPQIWLFSSDLIHVMRKNVKGFEPHPSTFFQGLVTTWLE